MLKNVGPCPAHDMVGSGQIWAGSDWPAILCVIFGLNQIFLSFGSNISAVPDPSLGRVGSVFFSGRLGRICRVGWPVIRSIS